MIENQGESCYSESARLKTQDPNRNPVFFGKFKTHQCEPNGIPSNKLTSRLSTRKRRWLDGSPYAKAWRFTLDSEDPQRLFGRVQLNLVKGNYECGGEFSSCLIPNMNRYLIFVSCMNNSCDSIMMKQVVQYPTFEKTQESLAQYLQ